MGIGRMGRTLEMLTNNEPCVSGLARVVRAPAPEGERRNRGFTPLL